LRPSPLSARQAAGCSLSRNTLCSPARRVVGCRGAVSSRSPEYPPVPSGRRVVRDKTVNRMTSFTGVRHLIRWATPWGSRPPNRFPDEPSSARGHVQRPGLSAGGHAQSSAQTVSRTGLCPALGVRGGHVQRSGVSVGRGHAQSLAQTVSRTGLCPALGVGGGHVQWPG
jgi:hypothetical protein